MNADNERIFDCLIIGGGPAGLSAALVLGRARRSVLVIDSGQPRNAAAKRINGYLGHDGIPPREFHELGRAEIARYSVDLREDFVTSAARAGDNALEFPTLFRIETKHDFTALGRKLLFATGMRDELPQLTGLRECYGVSVHHCPYCDGWEHRDQRIAVYAQEPHEAVGLAIALHGWSSHVTALSGGKPFAAKDAIRLSRAGIARREEAIVRLVHDNGQMQGIELRQGDIVPADAMFFETVQHPGCDLPRMLGVRCDDEFSGRTNRKQKTDVPGVFLAGDADGDVEFVVVAAAEGATAAVAINRELLEEAAPPK